VVDCGVFFEEMAELFNINLPDWSLMPVFALKAMGHL
jgi:hypothetical protein